MSSILDLHLDGSLVQAIEIRSLGFYNFVPAQRQRAGSGHSVLICFDRVHQIARPSIVDLKLGIGDGGSGGPAIHGVVVRTGLAYLNLASNGGILPGDLRSGAVCNIHGLELLIHDVALVLQLTQVIPPGTGQIIDVDIAPIIAGVLSNRILIGIVEEEGHTINPLTGSRINFMDEDTAECFVGHSEGNCFPILHFEIVGRGVHLEAFRCLDFYSVVGAVLQGDKDAAILPGGHSIDEFVVNFADLKGGVGDALRLVGSIDLDDFYPADGLVIEGQRLGICGVDHHGLALAGRVNGVARDRLGFLDYDGAGDTADSDLTIFIRRIESLAGQVAVCIIHKATTGVGQLKFHTGQGLQGLGIQLSDDKGSLSLIVEPECLDLASFDLDTLGRGVQDIALHRLDLPHGDGGAGLQIGNNNAAILVRNVLTVAGTYDRTTGICHQEGHSLQRSGGTLDVLLDNKGGAGCIVKGQCLGIIWIDLNGLSLRGRVNGVARDALNLSHYQGTYYAINLNFTLTVGLVETVAGDVAILVRDILPGGSCDLEGDTLQRLSCARIPLVDDEGTGLGVGDNNRLCIAALTNHHIGGRSIHHITGRSLDFSQYISAGS